jgi:hypothetical protein
MILDSGPIEATNGLLRIASTCLYELECAYENVSFQPISNCDMLVLHSS